jgi:hypothetical protein
MLHMQSSRSESSELNLIAVKVTELSFQIVRFAVNAEHKNSVAHV